MSDTNIAMGHYFRSCASKMALCKALVKDGGTAIGTLVKLSAAVYEDARAVSLPLHND